MSASEGPATARQVPYHCPYCAEEDLRPHGTTGGAWHCRACLRTFSVKYLGLEPRTPSHPIPSDPHTTGASR